MKRSVFGLYVLFLLSSAGAAEAGWSSFGLVPFSGASDLLQNCVVPDGSGGAFVVGTTPNPYQPGSRMIVVQRVADDGSLLWPNPIEAVVASGGKQFADAVPDGVGGIIVVWKNAVTLGYAYAQHVDADGDVLWGVSGIQVTDENAAVSVASDGSGGAIVGYYSSTAGQIRAVRFGSTGTVLWTKPVAATVSASEWAPRLIADGAGGAYAAWMYNDAIDDIHGQHIDGNGDRLWGTTGVVVFDGNVEKRFPDIAAVAGGGMIAVWADYRNGLISRPFMQRIDAAGLRAWDPNGIPIPGANGTNDPVIVNDDGGGWVASWIDWLAGEITVFAQRVDLDGNALWTPGGVAVVAGGDWKRVMADGQGGVLFAARSSNPSLGGVISAQRVDLSGTALWDGDRIVFTGVPSNEGRPGLAITESGFAFASVDGPGGRVQRLDLMIGAFGSPEPTGVAAADNPYDQGGEVLVQWLASDLDLRPNTTVTHYTVWRSPAGAGAWTQVGTQPARYAASHSLLVPTPEDGTPYDWRVRTNTADANMWWDSDAATAASEAPAVTGVPLPSLARLEVGANTPNPFASVTTLRIGLPQAGAVSIEVFDVAGRRVASRREAGGAGWNAIPFDGRGDSGRALASGVYFYRVTTAAGETVTRKLVIQR